MDTSSGALPHPALEPAGGTGDDALRDLDLVRAVQRDEPHACQAFLVRMRVVPRMLSAVNLRFGSPLDAHDLADLTQDSLILLWRKLPEYDGRALLESWVYGIVRLEYMNGLRRRHRRAASLDEVASEPRQPAEPEVDVELVRRCLARLEPDEERMIRMRHFEDLTFEAAAARLGIALSTAKSRYYRGLERLQSSLHPREQGSPR